MDSAVTEDSSALVFVAYEPGEDERHWDPCRRRVVKAPWEEHLGYSLNRVRSQQYAVRVPVEAGRRWDPYLHHVYPEVRQERRWALATTYLASE